MKNLSGSCDCISTFQVEVEDFDNEIFVLSVEARDKEEASTILQREFYRKTIGIFENCSKLLIIFAVGMMIGLLL